MSKTYITIVPRYIDGKYINASPEYPAEVQFPDHIKVTCDGTLREKVEAEEPGATEPLKPAFASKTPPSVPHAHSRDKAAPGKRASDTDPAK